MKILTSELIGPALDWAVATLEGYGGLRNNPHLFNQALIMNRKDGQCVLFSTLNFSANWAIAGPIIEREGITIGKTRHGFWEAHRRTYDDRECYQVDNSPLIAAMRCHVASKLGDEIEIPKELLR